MDVKIYLVGGHALYMATAVARLIDELNRRCIAELEARVVEVSELPTGCSNDLPCPEPVLSGDGFFCGHGSYYPALSIKQAVANVLRERPRPAARPYVPKTIGIPYRGYASTFRQHRR